VRRLSSLAWRSLGARKMRSFLTTAGIALGVAVLFAALSAGVTMDAAVDRAAADEMGRADLRVGPRGAGLSQATVDVIAQTAGVSVAAPALERRTYLAARVGQTSPLNLPAPVTVLGIDPVLEPRLHDMPLAAGGLLTAGDLQSALITQTLADQENFRLGDSISLNGSASAGRKTYRIVGIVDGMGRFLRLREGSSSCR